jgi:hypothetical protein
MHKDPEKSIIEEKAAWRKLITINRPAQVQNQ